MFPCQSQSNLTPTFASYRDTAQSQHKYLWATNCLAKANIIIISNANKLTIRGGNRQSLLDLFEGDCAGNLIFYSIPQ